MSFGDSIFLCNHEANHECVHFLETFLAFSTNSFLHQTDQIIDVR